MIKMAKGQLALASIPLALGVVLIAIQIKEGASLLLLFAVALISALAVAAQWRTYKWSLVRYPQKPWLRALVWLTWPMLAAVVVWLILLASLDRTPRASTRLTSSAEARRFPLNPVKASGIHLTVRGGLAPRAEVAKATAAASSTNREHRKPTRRSRRACPRT